MLSSSRNCLPLKSKAWKDIFQRLRIDSSSHFLQKSQDDLHGKIGKVGNLFSITVNQQVQRPLDFTGTIPKFNMINNVFSEKLSKFMRDGSRINLIGMRQEIKNSLGSMNRVCDDDDDALDIGNINSLIYTISNGK